MDAIYFDYAAATPVAPEVQSAMLPYLTEQFYNPSATYAAAREVARDVEAARARVAHHLGARPVDVIFTAGGTEANNLAVHGVMSSYPDGNVVVSAIEHEALLAPAHLYDCREVAVDEQGIIDVPALAKAIDDKTVLVSVMYANNEIGTIQPLKQVAALVRRIRTDRKATGNELPLYLHTDACQAANFLDLHVSRLGVDMMTLNAGKIYGPKQCGALYAHSSVGLNPQIVGGGQERGRRSGTENVAGIIGFAKALDMAQEQRHEEAARLGELQRLFLELLAEKLPSAVINGSRKHRLPNNVHVTLPGTDNERLLFALDEQGIIAAVGSACSASNEEPSHVLRALGLSDEAARSSLRFTMGKHSDEAGVHRAVDVLVSLVA
jgi:cysteine desulfurase